jgi:tetratricopeptide (TPR) repeat protein
MTNSILPRQLLLLLLWAVLLTPLVGRSAQSPEDQAMTTAHSLFDDKQYGMAETNLAHFIATYTNSPYLPYAILYLARARLEQSNYDGALQKLTTAPAPPPELSQEYAFWIGRARLDKGDDAQAAADFGAFVKNSPANAPRLMEAAYDEAQAYAELKNWPKVIELLQKPDGVFHKLSSGAVKNTFSARGILLLGEALFSEGQYAGGEKIINGLDVAGLGAEWQWRRQYLLARLELAGGRAAAALASSSNLLDTASGPRHQAASRFLRGEIYEALGRTNEALSAYTNNLAVDLTPEDQKQALLKTVGIVLAQGRVTDAAQFLEGYVAQRTNSAALDLAHLSLGELYLKLHYLPIPAAKTSDLVLVVTNFIDEALTNFNVVISNYPNSALAPQAHLDRGWCYWAVTNMAAAREDFQAATDRLGHSPEQAVARFKVADVEFYQRDYAGALSNYNLILRDYAAMPSVADGLFDQALYQIVQCSLARGDQAGAQAALKRILDSYPDSLFGDRGQLLLGENIRFDYAMARRVFGELLRRSPNTPLLPEVQYAIARTYEQQGNWPESLRLYNEWITQHASNAPALLPRVEYARALVYGKAGMETNALALMSNFVAHYQSNDLAPWAQNWVADYYYNTGDNQKAEANYLLLSQTFPNAGTLAYEAQLMAGRAALARPDLAEARQHFSDLVNNSNAPVDLLDQGYFALGDTIQQQFLDNPTNETFFSEAIKALSNLTNGAPTNKLAVQAYGRLGDYYSEWADLHADPKRGPPDYTNATQMYQTVLNFPASAVDVTTRSLAEVALGRIAERLNQTNDALAHYCKVLYELDPAHYDPFWIGQAGAAACRLYESQQQWDKAIKVYQRVLQATPSLRGTLQKAIAADQIQLDRARN